MKRLSAIFLALGLAVAAGGAAAQTYGGYGNDPYNGYGNDPYSGNGYGNRVTNTVPDRYGNRSNALYDYARVIRVDPVIDSRYRNDNYGRNTYVGNDRYTVVDGMRCYESSGGRYVNDRYVNDRYERGYDPYGGQQGSYGGTNTGRTMATVLGGVAGALIGSKVGGGSGSVAATAIGTMVGGMAGRQIYESTQRRRYESSAVQVCDPTPNGQYGGYNDGYANNGYTNAGYNGRDDARVVGYDVTYEYAGRRFVTRTDYHPGDRIRVRVDVRPE